ncbi:3048_t:CDS:2 [Cetraspora pellucida]|uniref:3048_t:CDS:1 n=1 Tax=Cetraspora pellucida TaxID=1433469 RepID=A0A9N9FHV8_9GLOM|nr:3048_t:CDS:2 [Cetraspora pellucida]
MGIPLPTRVGKKKKRGPDATSKLPAGRVCQQRERLKPQEEKAQAGVGSLKEIIDDDHAVVSSSTGPEYHVSILSSVDIQFYMPVVGVLQDNTDPMVSVMKLEKAPTELHADIGVLEQQIQGIKNRRITLNTSRNL